MLCGYVTLILLILGSGRGVILDVLSQLDPSQFLKFLKGSLVQVHVLHTISDAGKNFISVETQEFFSRLGIA